MSNIPSSGLIDAFGNEVCRKGIFKLTLALERIMNLGIGHTSTLEPAVKHLRDATQWSLPASGWDGQVVDADKQKSCTSIHCEELNSLNANLTRSHLCVMLQYFGE